MALAFTRAVRGYTVMRPACGGGWMQLFHFPLSRKGGDCVSARSHIGSRYTLSIRRGIYGEACWPCLANGQAQPDAEATLTDWPVPSRGTLGGRVVSHALPRGWHAVLPLCQLRWACLVAAVCGVSQTLLLNWALLALEC